MRQRESKLSFKYYISVWRRIITAAEKRSKMYRADLLFRFLRAIFLLGVQILFLNAVFGSSDIYVGWSKSEAYLVMGMWNILNYLGWAFFGSNLLALESKIIEGRFDYTLLKPLSSAWFASFGDFFIHNFVTSLSGVILVLYYISLEWNTLILSNILLSLFALCIGLVIWYCIYLSLASFTISKPRNGLLSVAKELLGVTRYPIDIFGEQFKIIFYTVVPIAFLTTVPASIMIGRITWIYILGSILVAGVMLFLSLQLWKRNLKGYTSASS